ncbi:MAG: M67 family metallopeptidase [Synergistaceae bacterium]|jgi:proteasome lid subunit RPN8/RPN11|nr:M67 family metallopeptidase [Synergistaceae bacterium]
MISLSRGAVQQIASEGERAYPNECCGALLGKDDADTGRVASEIFPVHNAFGSEEQYHRFAISPEDCFFIERDAERRGLDVIGFYHSHPDHPAIPSEYDREHAMYWYSYVIVAIERGRAGGLTSWRLASDRSAFAQERVLQLDVR